MQSLRLSAKLSRNYSYKRFSIMAPVKTQAAARDFLSFVNASPTPYHAVKSAKARLTEAGFKEIKVRTAGRFVDSSDLERRRKSHGLRHASLVESTILPGMARPSSHSPSGRSGSQEMDWP